MNFPATSPTKETSGVTFSVTSRRSLDCGRPTTGSDEGNSSRDFEMNRLAVHHFRYRAPIISGNFIMSHEREFRGGVAWESPRKC
jgi:hypothetical protein